jgi:hypothetical protein
MESDKAQSQNGSGNGGEEPTLFHPAPAFVDERLASSDAK